MESEETILILTPTGTDKKNTLLLLEENGFRAKSCQDFNQLCAFAREGVGALLLAEEAFSRTVPPCFVQLLKEQPSWSELPIIVATSSAEASLSNPPLFQTLDELGNCIMLERPFRRVTLVSTLRGALRARRRQYQVRDFMAALETRVAERTLALQETIATLETLLSSIAHDLRAPLRSLQGFALALLEDHASQLDESGKHYTTRIEKAAGRMDALVSDLLAYGRMSREPLVREILDLEHEVKEALGALEDQIQQMGAEVTVRIPIPAVRANKTAFHQILSNLLTNSLKFVRPGVKPAVEISAEVKNGEVVVFVRDNGIGVATEHQGRIFRVFERLYSSEVFQGTGMGLAIVSKAVDRMGGRCGVDSVPNVGSTFWFSLPKL